MIKGTTTIGFDTHPNGEAKSVKLKDDRVLKAAIVVVGVGAIPLTDLFEGQVETEKRGIKMCAHFSLFRSELNNQESRRVFKKSPQS
ncbi:hypothetical protein FXO37_25952 [Capsicum annuum]|nr:hypothetical protein FXO37_25952 [Capsicum annuum]